MVGDLVLHVKSGRHLRDRLACKTTSGNLHPFQPSCAMRDTGMLLSLLPVWDLLLLTLVLPARAPATRATALDSCARSASCGREGTRWCLQSFAHLSSSAVRLGRTGLNFQRPSCSRPSIFQQSGCEWSRAQKSHTANFQESRTERTNEKTSRILPVPTWTFQILTPRAWQATPTSICFDTSCSKYLAPAVLTKAYCSKVCAALVLFLPLSPIVVSLDLAEPI